VREWTLTLPSEFPFWELEFRWTPKSSKSDFRGQNPLNWGVIYIITKLLEHRCLKWACMTHLDTSNTSYGQKKGLKVKLPIWFPTTKNQESPRFPCVQVACHILLESSWLELQLCFRPHLNQRSTHKVMGPQSCKTPNFGNFKSPWTKWHLGAGLVAMHKVYYKGEGGGFPQVWVVVSLMNLCLLLARLCTKVFQLRIN